MRGHFDVPALLLWFALTVWIGGFDLIYSCQDVDFDRQAGLRSAPAWIGVRASLRLAAACHLVMVLLLGLLWWAAYPDLGAIYLTGLAAVGALAGEHHAVLLANHGPVVAGTSLENAQYATEELEETAKLFLMLRGQAIKPLTPAEVRDLRERYNLR